ncbi:hypothetical protein GCM10017044_21890 [Kordiimonas sediminis]|uniref:MlaB-like STAS domain-containing protein n=1 Tax=Kordiimonas sediminis TaxID=1735581 RepID=A0A919E7J1_9PROT|nr:STAS domain-containing protein [Kordiimonas sediminis]GHF26529.1 hypothetical protein GCM10017044_21890 [Kordiimonas sediminis]
MSSGELISGHCSNVTSGWIHMEYKIDHHGAQATIRFQGDITFSENYTFRRMLSDVSAGKYSACTFDLSGVSMIDSAGLGMFLIAKENADNEGWALQVTGATGHVADMLNLTQLSKILNQA